MDMVNADAQLEPFLAGLATPAAALATRAEAWAPRAANRAWTARLGAEAGIEAIGDARGVARARAALLAGTEAAIAVGAGGEGGRSLALLLPVRGGHGDAIRTLVALVPLEGPSPARCAIAAVADLLAQVERLNADLRARRAPHPSCEILRGFDARAYAGACVAGL